MSPRLRQSPYMHFAKLHTGGRFNLAASGVPDRTLEDIGADLSQLGPLQGPNAYGWAPLVERLAGRFGIDPASVVQAAGASFANHLAMAALIDPGDRVLIESPAYELMVSTLRYLGAEVVFFERTAASGFRLDPAAVAAKLTPDTRLIVATELHNPSSVRADPADLKAVADLARDAGARFLVDEVYRELTFTGEQAETAFTLGPHVVVTSSLTKAYGLSGLRCGWVLAEPELAGRMWRLHDLIYARGPFLTDQLSLMALDRLPALRARSLDAIARNLEAYRQLLGGHPALEQTIPEIGTTVFPRLVSGDADAFVTRLADEFETGVVPGRFFFAPEHIRIGVAGDPDVTRQGLERISRALERSLSRERA